MAQCLESCERSTPRVGMIHYRQRVVPAQRDTSLRQLIRTREPWRMHPFRRQLGEFRNIAFDETPVRIVLLRLRHRIEDPNPRLSITTRRCGPLSRRGISVVRSMNAATTTNVSMPVPPAHALDEPFRAPPARNLRLGV